MTTLHAEVRENGLVDSWTVVVVRDHGDGDVVQTIVATGLTREASDAHAKRFNDNVAFTLEGLPNVVVAKIVRTRHETVRLDNGREIALRIRETTKL